MLQDITALLRKIFAHQSPANSSVQEDISVQMVLLTHSVVPQEHIREGNTRPRVISAQKVITVWQILLIHILVQHIITAPTELILQLSVQMGRLRMTMLPSWVIWISADHAMLGTFVNWELSQVTVLQDTCVTLGAPLLLQTAQTKQLVNCARLGSTVLLGHFIVSHVNLDLSLHMKEHALRKRVKHVPLGGSVTLGVQFPTNVQSATTVHTMIPRRRVPCKHSITCPVQQISASVTHVPPGIIAGMKHCQITPPPHVQWVSIVQTLRTVPSLVQMEHSVTPQELATYPTAISALLGAFVRSPTVVSMDTSVPMAPTALLEELRRLFVFLVTFVMRPNRKHLVLKGITVRRDLPHLYHVLRDITVIQPIAVITIPTIKMPGLVIRTFVH